MQHVMIIGPVLVTLTSILYYMQHVEWCLVVVWAIATYPFTLPLQLLPTVLLAVFWNILLAAVLVITTLLPQYTRKGFFICAVVGALIPNLFAHPLHVHPIRLALRLAIVHIVPKDYIWYVIVPEWFIGIVIWRMLRHHYPTQVTTHEPV